MGELAPTFLLAALTGDIVDGTSKFK